MDKQQDHHTLTVIKHVHDGKQGFVQADLLMSKNTCKPCVIVENISTTQLIATDKNETKQIMLCVIFSLSKPSLRIL